MLRKLCFSLTIYILSLGLALAANTSTDPSNSIDKQNPLQTGKSLTNIENEAVKNFFENSHYEDFTEHPDTTLFDKNHLAPSS